MEIESSFVKGRLAETSYANRESIMHLRMIEDWCRRRPNNTASSMLVHHLRTTYPVEWRIICRELLHGIVATPEEIEAAYAEHAAKIVAEQEAEFRAMAAADAARREEWKKAGGRP